MTQGSDVTSELRSSDPEARLKALLNLQSKASTGDQTAIAALRQVVTSPAEYDLEIVGRILNQVEDLGGPSLEAPLLAMLQEHRLDMWAAAACGTLGFTAATPLLLTLLTSGSGLERGAAATALSQLGADDMVEPIAARLDDESEFVRADAADALVRIGTEAAHEALWTAFETGSFERPHYLANALGRWSPPDIDRMGALALTSGDPNLRFWAARGLGATGDPRARAVLESLLDDDALTTFRGQVRTAAKHGLRTLDRFEAHRSPRQS